LFLFVVISSTTKLTKLRTPTPEWRKLHNKDVNDLYSSPNIVRMIKSRIIRWTEHIGRMGKRRGI
jgi:hypothetical protein